jgi:hypothetical protein
MGEKKRRGISHTAKQLGLQVHGVEGVGDLIVVRLDLTCRSASIVSSGSSSGPYLNFLESPFDVATQSREQPGQRDKSIPHIQKGKIGEDISHTLSEVLKTLVVRHVGGRGG